MVIAALAVALLEAGDGVKVSAPVVIAHADSPAGAVDRAGALAVWREHGCIEIARLAPDATAGKPVELGCGASGAPRAASSGEVTLVVWPTAGELAGALVTPELKVTPIHVKGAHAVAVTAAYDGHQFLATSASCAAAHLIAFDQAGAVTKMTGIAAAKPHDDIVIGGAVVACEGGACEVAYARANATLGISCEDEIRKPRWLELHIAPLVAGVPGTFAFTDEPTKRFDPAQRLIARHGLTWPIGGFNTRRDSGVSANGSVVATTSYHSELWNGREKVSPDHVELEFVAADPKAAHHAPLAVPDETSPAVLALGGERFVLLTAARDGVVARAITIDLAWFTHPPQPRGPVLEGRLRTSNQKPPTMARVSCLTRPDLYRESTVRPDGTFVVPVADPLDFRVAAQTDGVPMVAYAGGDEYWFSPAQHETRADIQLAPPARITGTIEWPGGSRPKVAPMPAQYVERGPRGKERLPDRDPLELLFQAHALVPAIAPYQLEALTSMYSYPLNLNGTFDVPVASTGRTLFVAETANHEYGATAWVKTQPGKSVHLTLPLKKTATLTVRMKGVPWSIDGDDMRLASGMCATDGRGCTFEHISPGPQWLSVTTPDWSMVRMLDVAPGETKTLLIPFVADLPAGDAGVHVARAIDGITVTAVAPGGPAAGQLAPGDVIAAIDGTAAGTDLAAVIGKLRGAPDSRVELTVVRNRRPQKLTLTRTHGTASP